MRRDLVVFMETVVEHLILEPERGVVWRRGHRKLFRDVVFDAAVPRPTDLPIPGQLEVAESLAGHEIATGRRLSVRQSRNLTIRNFSDCAVLDLPVCARHAIVAETAPAAECPAIEKQTPPVTLLR